jgi:hypothetical protein
MCRRHHKNLTTPGESRDIHVKDSIARKACRELFGHFQTVDLYEIFTENSSEEVLGNELFFLSDRHAGIGRKNRQTLPKTRTETIRNVIPMGHGLTQAAYPVQIQWEFS